MGAARKHERAEDGHFELLLRAAGSFAAGDAKAAEAALRSLPPLEAGHRQGDLRTLLFLKALWRRLDRSLQPEANLYLRGFELSQIDLFNLLARRMPLVYQVAAAANEALGCLLRLGDRATLLDIGVGTGRQIEALLESQGAARALPKLRVVGVEPSRSSLEAARGTILGAAGRLGVELEFVGIEGRAEDLGDEQWRLIRGDGAPVVVNEAFALHHVSPGARGGAAGGGDAKDRVLERVAGLQPLGFVLSEPSSDHETPDLRARFAEAWHHYGLVFDVIDEQPLSRAEQDAMKVCFFAREIEDVVGMPEEARTERHETAAMWMARLARAGLAPLDSVLSGRPGTEDAVERARARDHVSFRHRGQPVVALMAVAPRGRRSGG